MNPEGSDDSQAQKVDGLDKLFQEALSNGERLKMGAGNSFRLLDLGCCWLVTRGTVDLFSIPVRQGEAIGPRDHLCRVKERNIFFSLPSAADDENLVFEAVGFPDTEVIKVELAKLKEWSASGRHVEAIGHLLDIWTVSLCRGLSFGLVPLDVKRWVAPGKDVDVHDGEVVSTKEAITWAFQLEGSSRFMGKHDLGIIQSGGIIPLCRHSWLQAEGPARFHGESTSDLLGTGNRLWSALEGFHPLVSQVMSISRRRGSEEARQRLAQRREEDQRLTHKAYAEFEAVLDHPVDEPAQDADEPLLAACRLIGEQMKLKVFPCKTEPSDDRLDHPLQRIARASGFRVREVSLKGEWWSVDNGHLLGYLEKNDQPICLIQSKPGRYILRDPVDGKRVKVDKAVAKDLKSAAYMLYKPLPAGPVRGLDLLRIGATGLKGDFWIIAAMGALAGLLSLIIPIATGYLFSTVIPSGEKTQLLEIVAALLVSAIAIGVFGLVQALAQLRAAGRMGAALEAALWDRLINLPTGFFKKYTAGDLAGRALGISRIQQLLSGAAISGVVSTVFLSFNLGLIYYYGGFRLFLAALLIIFFILVFAAIFCKIQLRFQRPQMDIMGRLQGLTLRLINGIAKLRVSGAEKRAFAQWAGRFAKQKRLEFRTRTVTNLVIVMTSSAPLVALVLVFALVVLLHDSDLQKISTGQFLAYNTAFSSILASILHTMIFIFPLLSAIPLYERTRPILEATPETDGSKAWVTELGGNLEISEVSFQYQPDGPMVLKNVSLHATPGEFIALVGPSGSGKSTIFRLILGFETPGSGSVYFDRRDLRGLSIQSVRKRIGVVLQTGRLLPGSVYENIVGATQLTLKDAWIAARMAALDKDIEQMPMGMQTFIGEGGSGLSGGQRQRLLIARALVRRPRILLFDEATSALDNESQSVVSESLESLQATRIVIAHRLSTVKNADRIYALEGGEVTESGAYEELIAKGGAFARLAQRQII